MSSGKIQHIYKRDKELVEIFYQQLGMYGSVQQALVHTVNHHCSQFFISSETASKCVSAQLRGRFRCRNPLRRKMILDIIERCDGDYSLENIERVIYGGAPAFYITTENARKIIREKRKRYYVSTHKS